MATTTFPLTPAYTDLTTYPGPTLQYGTKGDKVRLLQEWLNIHGMHVVVDGDFGPATRAAIQSIQKLVGLKPTGLCDADLWSRFVAPMQAACAAKGRIVEVAEAHLFWNPREVGGANRGPWVRLYMDGNQGDAWAWCAGFAGFILRQSLASRDLPFASAGPRTFSCDVLAADFKARSRLITQATPAQVKANVQPGDLFFVVNSKNKEDRVHVGIVTAVKDNGNVIETIEGNTNDEGSREGYEVCARMRRVGQLDFGQM